jgi:hypothetical protein
MSSFVLGYFWEVLGVDLRVMEGTTSRVMGSFCIVSVAHFLRGAPSLMTDCRSCRVRDILQTRQVWAWIWESDCDIRATAQS